MASRSKTRSGSWWRLVRWCILPLIVLLAGMATPADAAWEPVGPAVPGGGTSIVDVSGVPHLALLDPSGPGPIVIRVKRWNGSAWVDLGGPLRFDPQRAITSDPVLAAVNGVPHVAWAEDGPILNQEGDPLGRVHVALFNGTEWVFAGGPLTADPQADDAREPTLAAVGGVAHVSWSATAGSGPPLRRYVAGTWETLPDVPDAEGEGGGVSPQLAEIAGVLHVARPVYINGIGKLRVSRFSGGIWSPVGGVVSHGQRVTQRPALIDHDGVPVVGWRELSANFMSSTAYVARFSGGVWTDLGGALNAGGRFASGPVLASAGGRPVAAWSEFLNGAEGAAEIRAATFDGQAWVQASRALDRSADEPTGVTSMATVAGVAHLAWIEGDATYVDKDARSDSSFARAWGEDVVQGGPTGFEVCTVASACKEGSLNDPTGGSLEPEDAAVGPEGNVM